METAIGRWGGLSFGDSEDQMVMMLHVHDDDDPLEALTPKQRDVLDLLIQHKTSKEISRLLGISPHTVDQRIMLARAKLHVATRGEVAQAYRRLVEKRRNSAVSEENTIYEKPVYQPSYLPVSDSVMHFDGREDEVLVRQHADLFRQGPQQMATAAGPGVEADYYRVLPEVFDGPNGTLMRLGAIAAITVFLILIILGGLSIFSQLSRIIGH